MPRQAPRTDAPILGLHNPIYVPDPAGEELRIGLEINAEKLYQLLVCGAVRMTDFRCLDRASKHSVRRLCLHACAQRLRETVGGAARRRGARRRS